MTVTMIGGGENVMRWKDGSALHLLKSFDSIIRSSIFKKVSSCHMTHVHSATVVALGVEFRITFNSFNCY